MEKSKLTAYALNEVSEAERAEIEAYLNSHPMEKAEVEEIKLVSSILKAEMATDLVVTPPPLPKKKMSFWGKLMQPKVLVPALGFAIIGIVALPTLWDRFVWQMTTRPEQTAMSPEPDTINTVGNGRLVETRGVRPQTTAMAERKQIGGISAEGARSTKDDLASREYEDAQPMTTTSGQSPTGAPIDGMDSSAKGRANSFGGLGDPAAPQMMAKKSLVEPGRMPMPATPAPEIKEDTNSGEEYKQNAENDFVQVSKEALSTFSIDVDTASYANARRYLTNYTQIPPVDSIRTEEFVNYFDYDYKAPTSGHPIAVHLEATKSPWNSNRAIVRIGLKGKEIEVKDRPKSNLVFLIDVSGSMEDENKLPLVKSALKTLTEQLTEKDRISMVVYAGSSGVVLESTPGDKKDKILTAIQNLSAGGGTNGEGGIRKAYEIAMKNYVSGGNNRVILASDGDFNVGVTSPKELLDIIKEKSEGGVFLTVLGFGMGNYKDARLEEISNKGQGNYFYIDTAKEANKVFVNQLSGTLFTIAKDVKVQVEFNPKVVHSYRLVGYENRMLNKEDFANDKVDAGEMGAGHSVTALYEIEWKGNAPSDIKLKYQTEEKVKDTPGATDEILTAKIRYKKPTNSTSEYFEQALANKVAPLSETSCSTRFAVAVASFSLWMRKSAQLKDFDSNKILEISEGCLKTKDKKDSFKEEFVDLVKKAREIRK
tara:strand:- start:69077 stop:71206 length:2130 start_codon:yes stop_codon:yes gene_type:complete